MSSRAVALLIFAALVVPTAASADSSPSPEELAEARIHFERARGFEEAEQYARAADEYLSAYALYPDPEFFFNAGRVYRLAGDRQRALRFYERYLELDPDGRGADAARAQVESLREELGDDEAAKREPASEPRGERDDRERDDAGEQPAIDTPGPLDPSDPDATIDDGTSSGGSPSMRMAGVMTGTAGLVALGASVYFGNRARSLSNQIDEFVAGEPNAWTGEWIDKYDQGRRANTTMLVLGGLGVAAVTTGAVLYVVGGDSDGAESRGVAIAPAWMPGGAALTIGGSF